MTKDGKIIRSKKSDDYVVLDLKALRKKYGITMVSMSKDIGIHRITLKKMEDDHRIPVCYYEIFHERLPIAFPPIEEMIVENDNSFEKTVEDIDNAIELQEKRKEKKIKEIEKIEEVINRLKTSKERIQNNERVKDSFCLQNAESDDII